MDAQYYIHRYESLANRRQPWESQWQDCADYAWPQNNQITSRTTRGKQRHTERFDDTAILDNMKFSSGIYAYLFPINQKAFALQASEESLNENEQVKEWMSKVTDILHRELLQSNFRQALFEFLQGLGCFGTACMYVSEGKYTPLNFKANHISTIYIAENADGVIDTVYRVFEYTARQAVQAWGEENVGESVQKAYNKEDGKGIEEKFQFIHAIEPRTHRDPNKDDDLNMPFASVYVNVKDKHKIREGGYREMPYLVDRYIKDEYEVYGRSAAMMALTTTKLVSKISESTVDAMELANHPPMMVPNDGSVWPLRTSPKAVIYYNPMENAPQPYHSGARPEVNLEYIQYLHQKIHDAFLVPLFQALQDRRNMTATEVIERVEQNMRLIISVVGRLQSELLNPLIHRCVEILARAGQLPEPPMILQERSYRVEYLGKLAMSLRMVQGEGFTKTLSQMAAIGEVSPQQWQEILDNYELDTVLREMSRSNGVPANWMKDYKKMVQERVQRQQALQAQQMSEAAPKVAKAAKDLGNAPEEGSLMESLSGA